MINDEIMDRITYFGDSSLISEFDFQCMWSKARTFRWSHESYYDKYATYYEEIFTKYPNYIEPIYELALSSTCASERRRLFKICMNRESHFHKCHNGNIKLWMAEGGYIIESYKLEKYQDAYDCWLNIKDVLEKVDVMYDELANQITDCGIKSRDHLIGLATYARFQSELIEISKCRDVNKVPGQMDIHMVWILGNREYSLIHYLAVKCARETQTINGIPPRIYIYNDGEPINNVWWEKTKAYAHIEHITSPRHVNGTYIHTAQHSADVMRIWILYEFGGIYIDTDLLLTKSLQGISNMLVDTKKIDGSLETEGIETRTIILNDKIIMCQESDAKIWNGIIITYPHNEFLKLWIKEYETKYGTENGGCWWAGLSVETPMRLYKHDPNQVILIQKQVFLPFNLYDDTLYHYNDTNPYTECYGIHLWETEAEKRNVLPKNNEWFEDENNSKSIFSLMFKRYL